MAEKQLFLSGCYLDLLTDLCFKIFFVLSSTSRRTDGDAEHLRGSTAIIRRGLSYMGEFEIRYEHDSFWAVWKNTRCGMTHLTWVWFRREKLDLDFFF